MKRFEGKVAVITGGAQGIGLATAIRLLDEGARVLLSDIRPWEGSDASQSLTLSDTVHFVQADVSDRAQVDRMMNEAVETFGGIDVLISNAGVSKATPFLDLTEEEIDKGLRTNLFSMIFCGQAAIKQMQKQGRGGAIVHMSSVNALMTMSGYAVYNISKGGIEQLTRVMSLEMASHGIRVNAVGPGTILSNMTRTTVLTNDEARRQILSRTPIGRFGETSEVAATIAFLASDDASYITGETIFIDGGRRALNYTVPVND